MGLEKKIYRAAVSPCFSATKKESDNFCSSQTEDDHKAI